ncbi:MAG TPA: TonB family protein [Thermoanaerobaculia bacterium]|nr:TonB family protein [Thermoanaerobaculia bacterium]
MSSILVVEQEQRSMERIHQALSAEGWRVRMVQGRVQALQAAASEAPDLVLLSSEVAGADELAGSFSRAAGGPGVVVLQPEGARALRAPQADERLSRPYSDRDLVKAVRRVLATPRQSPAALSASKEQVRLTSQDIFGDVLAEVEGQVPGTPHLSPYPAHHGTAASAPSAAARSGDDEIQRKLEKTLSGVLGSDPRSRAAASGAAAGAGASGSAAAAKKADTEADVQALLDKTLSKFELGGGRPRPAGAAPATRTAPIAAIAAIAATAPVAAAAPAAAPADVGPARVPVVAVPPVPVVPGIPVIPPTPIVAPSPPASVSPAAAESAASAPPRPAAPPAEPAAGTAPPLAGPPTSAGAREPETAARKPTPPGVAAAAAAAAVPPGAAPASAASPAAPPSALQPGPRAAPGGREARDESTATRRLRTGEVDLSQLEDLARVRRKGDTGRIAVPVVPPAPPPPAAAAAAPPSAVSSQSPLAATGARPSGATAPPAAQAAPLASAAGAASAGTGSGARHRPIEDAAATQRVPVMPKEAGDQPGERFGQYTLLEKIAVGGMAEVWKARMRGVEGFQKTVAIKKILPYMTDNSEFVTMFIDEAKLAAQLSHPNIIHIYDLGKIGRDFFIAMEYVEGKDLRSLLNAARQHGVPLPLGLALLIAMRLASALDYAHRKRDFEGKEMGLVHRDVSPQNVLLSYDGDVKLCDFGIAKAVSKVNQTQAGALKGKLQYMSPEQAYGNPVDARTDIYSLGLVLFEMLTGERFFAGDTEISVLESVRQGKVRSPRQVDASVPPEVEEIVMRALATQPEGRFQSAGEMEQRLVAVVHSLRPSPGNADLSAFVKKVAQQAAPAAKLERTGTGRRGAAPARGTGTGQPTHAAHPAPAAAAHAAQSAHAAAAPAAQAAAAPEASPLAPIVPLTSVSASGSLEGERKGRMALIAGIAALLVAAVATYFYFGRARGPEVPAKPGTAQAGAATPPLPSGSSGAGAGTQPPPAAGAAGAAAAGATHPSVAKPAGPAGAATAADLAKAGKAAAGKTDVEGAVNQELAKREEALRQKYEEQQKKLQQEIAKAKPSPSDSQAEKPAAPARGTSAAAAPAAEAKPDASRPGAEGGSAGAATADSAQEKPAAAPAASSQPAADSSRRPDDAAAGSRAAQAPAAAAVVVPPQLVSYPKPEYPPLARKLRVEGSVVVSVLVDDQGQVEDARLLEGVVQSVGLNEAAVRVARSARFKPATKDGVKIKMWTRVRIPFKL